MSRAAREESGLAAPAVVTLAALLLVLAAVGAALGRALVDSRRAAAAADLSALAGATDVQHGGPGCPAARSVAADNGARLLSCAVDGEWVRVEAVVESPSLVGRTLLVRARAQAGPVR